MMRLARRKNFHLQNYGQQQQLKSENGQKGTFLTLKLAQNRLQRQEVFT
jgi:hypothetical protein